MKILQCTGLAIVILAQGAIFAAQPNPPREWLSIDDGWRFIKNDAPDAGTNFSYAALRPWILPTGNPFSTNTPFQRPADEPVQTPVSPRPVLTTANGGC